ncbi:hypothetical protein EVAR_19206_1 [Eumeta japonica]|uniref:Uncharacterized protein n=1 Tax=Eumeta variegata TaxID=151549 RepID=A0A4C1VFK9_EUMVA|nr:hypothetical protein EVAR_19206_1 [Eumeta japonica]
MSLTSLFSRNVAVLYLVCAKVYDRLPSLSHGEWTRPDPVSALLRIPRIRMESCFFLPDFKIKKEDLMMKPEGKLRNFIMKQRILDVFSLVEIALRCTLTMNYFQGLMMEHDGRQ